MIENEKTNEIKNQKCCVDFGKKVHKIRENVIKNINLLKRKENKIIGYGAPAKATTALNFFGISNEIDYIVEDNKLKHNKIVPGVNIPIYSKSKIREKNPTVIVLAWNFYKEIKSNNKNISNKFINVKDLENY